MNYEKIEHLMLSKSYDQLGPKEQRFVNKSMISEEEYEMLRNGLLISRLTIIKDDVDVHPDPAIQMRLISAMQLKPMKEQVVRQSFADFFISLFSPANLGLKAAVAMMVVAGSFWFGDRNMESHDFLISDSTQQFIDTSFNSTDDSAFVSTILFIH